MQVAADRAINANAPRGRAGRTGGDRPRRRGPGDGRRPRLCRLDLQSRHPGRAPAGIGVQVVRLSGGARSGDEADRHDGRRAGRRSTAGRPRNSTRTLRRPGDRCARPFRARSTPSAPRSAPSSASGRSPTWRGGSASAANISTYPSMVLGTSDVRLIDMTRAFASVAQPRRIGHALCDPQGRRRRRPTAVPARARARSGCWSRRGSRRE